MKIKFKCEKFDAATGVGIFWRLNEGIAILIFRYMVGVTWGEIE